MTIQQVVVLSIFGATYLALISAMRWKLAIVAVASLALMLWPGLLSVRSAFSAINWNVILLYFGMLLLTEALIMSKAPAVLAEKLVREGASARWAIVVICFVSGLISTVVENVAVVLIVAPVALAIAKRLSISPAPVLIGIAVSSNLQGAATQVGDPPSMLLAAELKLNFNDFFWLKGRPGIFWAVELGAAVSLLVLWVLFRKYRNPVPAPVAERLASVVPPALLIVMIAALAVASVAAPDWELGAGTIAMTAGVAAAIWWIARHGTSGFLRQARELDWETGLFLIGIFIVVGSLAANDLIGHVVTAVRRLSGANVLLSYTLLVWGSVAVSAFVDNVPYVAVMLPVCAGLARQMGVPPELYAFGMMVGASIGGNITPIGASANIVAAGIAKREGYPVSFRQFAAIGLPFTVAATAAVYVFVLLVWR